MTPETFSQAIVSIEKSYGLRLDARSVWLRMDATPCGRGWVGTKPPGCKRGGKPAETAAQPVKGHEQKTLDLKVVKTKVPAKEVKAKTPEIKPNESEVLKSTLQRLKTKLEESIAKDKIKASAASAVPKTASKTPEVAKTKTASKVSEAKTKTASKTPDAARTQFKPEELVKGPGLLDYSKVGAKLDQLAASGVTLLKKNSLDNQRPESVYKVNRGDNAAAAAAMANHFLSTPRESSFSALNKFRSGPKIADQSSFEKTFNSVVEAYEKGPGKGENLTPIYQVRRAMGDRVSRGDFDTHMLKMLAGKKVSLTSKSVEDSAQDKIFDSLSTPTSGVRALVRIVK